MLNLVKKEFQLAMHPVTALMLLLSAMVLIPNYPFVVIFFYIGLGLFFTCLQGRENNDVVYSLNLPIAKANVVKARILFTVIIEMIQLLLMVPCVILSQNINPAGNQAGMDANLALFGVGFIAYTLFNFFFFHSYYKNVRHVGIAFVTACIAEGLYCVVDIVSTYAIPFVRDTLDTPDSANIPAKMLFVAVCAVVYVIVTVAVCRFSIKNFAKQDLN